MSAVASSTARAAMLTRRCGEDMGGVEGAKEKVHAKMLW